MKNKSKIKRQSNKPRPKTRGLFEARSTHQRCPLCKHIRTKWFRANAWYPERKPWGHLYPGSPLICHICIERHSNRGEQMSIEKEIYLKAEIKALKRCAENCEKAGFADAAKNNLNKINDYRIALGLPKITNWQEAENNF